MAARIARGDVRLYDFAPPDKKRPVVVLTRNSAIAYLSTVTRSAYHIRGAGSAVRSRPERRRRHEGALRGEPPQCCHGVPAAVGKARDPAKFGAHERSLRRAALHSRVRCQLDVAAAIPGWRSKSGRELGYLLQGQFICDGICRKSPTFAKRRQIWATGDVDHQPLAGLVGRAGIGYHALAAMESKDLIAIVGIGVTFVVSSANLAYSLWSNKRAAFVNTVTTSRLKWIDSLRDKVSEFIAVTTRLLDSEFPLDKKNVGTLLLQRDTLLHEIVLHLNPHDPKDQRIRLRVDQVKGLTDQGVYSTALAEELVKLRDATSEYLKKEWNRVKTESTGKQS